MNPQDLYQKFEEEGFGSNEARGAYSFKQMKPNLTCSVLYTAYFFLLEMEIYNESLEKRYFSDFEIVEDSCHNFMSGISGYLDIISRIVCVQSKNHQIFGTNMIFSEMDSLVRESSFLLKAQNMLNKEIGGNYLAFDFSQKDSSLIKGKCMIVEDAAVFNFPATRFSCTLDYLEKF